MNNKYSNEFICPALWDDSVEHNGFFFYIESETLGKILSQFECDDFPDPEIDWPGFGWEDEWYELCDNQKIALPKDEASLKRWICAFFEMYGGYPLRMADMYRKEPEDCFPNESRRLLALEVERNIDAIVADACELKIVTATLLVGGNEPEWSGKTVLFKDGQLKCKKTTKTDAISYLEIYGEFL